MPNATDLCENCGHHREWHKEGLCALTSCGCAGLTEHPAAEPAEHEPERNAIEHHQDNESDLDPVELLHAMTSCSVG